MIDHAPVLSFSWVRAEKSAAWCIDIAVKDTSSILGISLELILEVAPVTALL